MEKKMTEFESNPYCIKDRRSPQMRAAPNKLTMLGIRNPSNLISKEKVV
jgi:hypothetical protein